jgi:hypothetical protein
MKMTIPKLNSYRKSFRIFDPNEPSPPRQNDPNGIDPQTQPTSNHAPNRQSEPLTRSEWLLDLHQQQMDAIQKATERIAFSLEITPGDHTS